MPTSQDHGSSRSGEPERPPRYSLVGVGQDVLGRVFHIGQGRHILGRAPESDVRLSLETISRKHALIVVAGDTVTIEDLQSRTGTFVDNRRIESCAIAPGARIVVGGLMLKLVVER